jgi:phospho-N-acetylmuramoyl-pentapeptide-transferase
MLAPFLFIMEATDALASNSRALLPSDGNSNLAISMGLSGLAFLMALIIGRPYIEFLRARKIGKQIRIEGPEGHQIKTGTPTMGGIIFSVTVVVLTVIFNLYGRLSMLLPLGVLIGCSILGGIDDKLNLVGGSTRGITARFKMAWLLAFAVITALVLHYALGLTNINIPFLGAYNIGFIYVPIAAFTIVGAANAVNLTDGLDTLAGGTAAVAFVSYGIIAYLQGQVAVVTFCFMMVGALFGFLWYNAHPAQVFMGDTGSLALGAALATAAFMTGQWLLLPIVGFVFMLETLSVMIQVAYFKATGGKRVFRMTPLHHHFELIGWSETQITLRFWLISMMAGLFGVALALV